MLKAAIFDVDNTLYDYDAAHAPAYRALSAFACEKRIPVGIVPPSTIA